MKTYLVTINGSFCYKAIARSSFDLHDAAIDIFGVCSISVMGVM